jgi:FlaA1/EpsC-like NDP-sugar epimerase
MANKYLPTHGELKIKTIGLQQGENLHEKILEEGPYSNEVELYSVSEIEEMV